jgi:hypothetical protein
MANQQEMQAPPQMKKEIYRLVIEPGLWRDYTTFSSQGCTYMNWFRWYHGRLRKIGGFQWIGGLNTYTTDSAFLPYNGPYGNPYTQPSYPGKQYLGQDLSKPFSATKDYYVAEKSQLEVNKDSVNHGLLVNTLEGRFGVEIQTGSGEAGYNQYFYNNEYGPDGTALPATFYDGTGIVTTTGWGIPRKIFAVVLDSVDKLVVTGDYNQPLNPLLPDNLVFQGTWNAQTNGTTNAQIFSIAYGLNAITKQSTYVAVGDVGTVLSSTNGVNWNVIIVGTDAFYSIAYNPQLALFCAVGAQGTIQTSPDGVNWTAQVSGTTQTLYAVTYGPTGFVVVGHAGANLISSNATTWTVQPVITTVNLLAITYGDQYVAVGQMGQIWSSPDSVTWTSQTSGVTVSLNSICFNGSNLYVVVGDTGNILTSPDNVTWTPQTSGTTHNLKGVCYNFVDLYVTVGEGGIILNSAAGVTWTPAVNPTPVPQYDLYAVVYGTDFLAVGAHGVCLSAPDGINWVIVSPLPIIVAGQGTIGWYYTVTVAGFQNLGLGRVYYTVGMMVFYDTTSHWNVQVQYGGVAFANEVYPVTPTDFVNGIFPPGFGYTPGSQYIWSLDALNLTTGQTSADTSTYIVAHASCPSGNISDDTPTYVFIIQASAMTAGALMSPLSASTPLSVQNPSLICNTEISVSGGVVAVGPFLFAYGANGLILNSDVNNPEKWAAVNSYAWQINPGLANAVNISNSKIVKGINFHGAGTYAALFWSLDSLIMATYCGAPNVFAYTVIATNITIIAQNSVVERAGTFYWLGDGRFFVYNGGLVQEVPNLQNKNWFFEGINPTYKNKAWGVLNAEYSEVIWHFPYGASTECNWMLIYNYESNCWYDCPITRGAGVYAAFIANQIWIDNVVNPATQKYDVFLHETGTDYVNEAGNAAAIPSSFVTPDIGFLSNTMMIGSPKTPYGLMGNFTEVIRVEPDFLGSGPWVLNFLTRKYANSAIMTSEDNPFSTNTEKIDCRIQDRIIQLQISNMAVNSNFFCGDFMITVNVGDAQGL